MGLRPCRGQAGGASREPRGGLAEDIHHQPVRLAGQAHVPCVEPALRAILAPVGPDACARASHVALGCRRHWLAASTSLLAVVRLTLNLGGVRPALRCDALCCGTAYTCMSPPPPWRPRPRARVECCIVAMSSTLAAAVCLAWLCLTAALPAPYGAAQRPLRFDADGSFQISIFEDLHFGESTYVPPFYSPRPPD